MNKQELERKLALAEHEDYCRKLNDKRYAKILVERIVYALITIITTGFLFKLSQLAFQNL